MEDKSEKYKNRNRFGRFKDSDGIIRRFYYKTPLELFEYESKNPKLKFIGLGESNPGVD